VSKKSAEMSNENVDAYFNEIENVIDNDNIYRNCLSIKQTLIDDVNAYVESLVQKIMKYKDNKINEIEHMFSHLDFFIEMIKDQIKETKTQMKQYNSKYSEFYSSCDDKPKTSKQLQM
jgi:REP element-mobilizing transposase RayT